MDPYQTYLDMFAAMQAKDPATARELAIVLHTWLAKGGFVPPQVTTELLQASLESVLRRTAGDHPAAAFSLTCRDCDAGENIETEQQAIAAGWIAIEPAFDLPMADYCGLCPDCQIEPRP